MSNHDCSIPYDNAGYNFNLGPINYSPVNEPSSPWSDDTFSTQVSSGKRCILWVHDEGFSREEVILNINIFKSTRPGDLLALLPCKKDSCPLDIQKKVSVSKENPSPRRDFSQRIDLDPSCSRIIDQHDTRHDFDPTNQYLFLVEDISKATKSGLEISVAKHIADAFGLKHRSCVLVTTADARTCSASHVELSFKDEYLARSDMWRLTVGELSNKIVYQGQKILFLSSVKAQVTAIYCQGQKVRSALFSTSSVPIFRSGSARYILFIQMSREMWEFDSEGSGEIMFNKVINGFLPSLFKKWAALRFEHLVTIVLFTRVEYDTGISSCLATNAHGDTFYTGAQSGVHRRPYKDFYRVVVCEMASASWTTILYQLKREFKFFRRDISMQRIDMNCESTPAPEKTGFGGVLGARVEAEPSLAMHGNVLEAINLASSQISYDHIDRDLMRTGHSIVIITPCAGLFEVDYENLKMTSELLAGNGISIDLICLPRVPLHSAPLFRYQNPHHSSYLEALRLKKLRRENNIQQEQSGEFAGSFSSLPDSLSPVNPLRAHRDLRTKANPHTSNNRLPDEWIYVMPHWLNISFWTGQSQEIYSSRISGQLNIKRLEELTPHRLSDFAVRCKMYEMEMAGIMESILTEISIIPLQCDPLFTQLAIETRPSPTNLIKRKKPCSSLSEFVPRISKGQLSQHYIQEERKLQHICDSYDLLKSRVSGERSRMWKKKINPNILKHGSSGASRSKTLEISAMDNSDSFKGAFTELPKSRRDKHLDASNAGEQLIQEFRKDSLKNKSTTAKNYLRSFREKNLDMSRKISLGKHGFGISSPSIAAAEIFTEHASATIPVSVSINPGPVETKNKKTKVAKNRLPEVSSPSLKRLESPRGESPHKSQPTLGPSARSVSDNWSIRGTPRGGPLTLRSALESLDSTNQFQSRSVLGSVCEDYDYDRNFNPKIGFLQSWTDNSPGVNDSKYLAGSISEFPPTLPPTPLSLWLTILNPSNPSLEKSPWPTHDKRWQHVFPETLPTKTMKWKSLCSPASVPMTTEKFPTKNQLDSEYEQKLYKISQNTDDDLIETHKSREGLLRELVGLRLSQGFQIVVGPLVAEAFGQKSLKIANIFDRNRIAEDGVSVFMSMNNVIHQLSCFNEGEVEINIFERMPSKSGISNQGFIYNPAIRTEFSQKYETQSLVLGSYKDDYNWNYVDAFLGGFNEEMTDNLRFWRARFVLIPVERPSRIHHQSEEDSDEEIRLEGIKKLTQMWQRHRIITASERRFQSFASGKSKDPNPLDIVYKTEDPSIVVAAELETLPIVETGDYGSRKSQLLETERFQKTKLDIAALAEAIQAPVEKGGVRMQNRRWHLRLHYNCFIGSDMTTWLIENFEDIETREEAIELGNKLMVEDEPTRNASKEKGKDRGIFVHVEKRHPFRDGQYFYQVTSEFAKQGLENRSGWFSSKKRDASVPSTPVGEGMSRGASKTEQSRSCLNNDDRSSDSGTATPRQSCGSKKPKVYLSKVIRYDVDFRKRSYRPEIINLHYDRLHNPDNCYHIRIDWLSATAKLIRDEIESWATTVERHGLRLVEAPIGEACTISSINPFRSPYRISLVIQPPDQHPTTYLDLNSFLPQPQSTLATGHYYQKAILKRFNFVLDIEAARNFPSYVDVLYSWGKPDYKYSQYIHRSGVLLAQITDDGSFLILTNRMHNNRTPKEDSLTSSRILDSSTPQSIQDDLEAFCRNSEALRDFYKDVCEKTEKTPLSVAMPPTGKNFTYGSLAESFIPALRLPPSIVAKETSSGLMRLNCGTYSSQLARYSKQGKSSDTEATCSPHDHMRI
ncbi:Vacuolar membrane-associated protein [Podosphaera aphanis]|nr:Vacuolar membrane-associated protein [Podosphaera aphanis]